MLEVGGGGGPALPLINMNQPLGGAGGYEKLAAFFLIRGTEAEGGFAVGGGGEDALDEDFGIAGGMDEAGYTVGDVLGLAALGGGDNG